MKVTYYGHACVGVEIEGQKILFDPFITENEYAKHINVESIETDFVLLSHGHFDHVADAAAICLRNNATLVSNFEIVSWFSQHGINKNHPMNLGGTKDFSFGRVRCVAALHSSTLPDGTYGGNPCGFIVSTPKTSFYFAGDTALSTEMTLIGKYWKPEVAFLPIGGNFTMNVEDALIAAEMIDCKRIIGIHFDTFPYIVINKHEAIQKFAEAGRELILLEIGSSIQL